MTRGAGCRQARTGSGHQTFKQAQATGPSSMFRPRLRTTEKGRGRRDASSRQLRSIDRSFVLSTERSCRLDAPVAPSQYGFQYGIRIDWPDSNTESLLAAPSQYRFQYGIRVGWGPPRRVRPDGDAYCKVGSANRAALARQLCRRDCQLCRRPLRRAPGPAVSGPHQRVNTKRSPAAGRLFPLPAPVRTAAQGLELCPDRRQPKPGRCSIETRSLSGVFKCCYLHYLSGAFAPAEARLQASHPDLL